MAFVRKILESRPHPMMAYPPTRVEAACTRALQANALSYKSVKAILEKGLDAVGFDKVSSSSPVTHPNIRGAAYYSESGADDNAYAADR